jgi:hypothetical protein
MARIRTIKPEFWQNEQLAGLPEHARLLAIALLNHSDDEGYFVASPQLVRAACFPFEEHSKNVLRSIHDLSGIGYIEVLDCGEKAVGWVCKFLQHQRIDKPQKSKLSELFQSTKIKKTNATDEFQEHSKNIPRTIEDHSGTGQRLEQGTGNREMEQGNGTGRGGTSSLEGHGWRIPNKFDTPRIRDLLGRFEEMRRKIKKPIRDFGNSSLVLNRFDDEEHLAYALETCIANDYQGLKTDYKPNGKSTKKEIPF